MCRMLNGGRGMRVCVCQVEISPTRRERRGGDVLLPLLLLVGRSKASEAIVREREGREREKGRGGGGEGRRGYGQP